MNTTTYTSLIAGLLISAGALAAAAADGVGTADDAATTAASTDEDPASPSTLEEVVVTARKKSEILQEVPMSVAAFDGDELEDRGVTNLNGLARYVPGLQQSDQAITSRMTLRGVNSGDNNAFEQAVGTYVNGIYRGRMNQQQIGLFDLERVEVLKGPQVTLYGNSSIGGAISVLTRQPEFEFGSDVRAGYEAEYDEPKIDAAVNLPLSESFALRLAGTWRDQREGTSPNDASGDSEPRSTDEAGRITALWLPSDVLSVTLRHEQGRFAREGHIFENYKHVDGHGNPWPNSPYVGLDDGRLNIGNGAPFRYQDAFKRTELTETMLDLSYDVGAVTLTSITGYSGYDFEESSDVDITPATLINVYQDERYRQFSQELRVSGRVAERIDYIAGVYLQRDDFRNDYLSDANMPALVAPAFGVPTVLIEGLIEPFSRHILLDQDTEQKSLFGNANIALNDDWTATLGYRWLMTDKDARQAVRTAGLDHVNAPGALIDVRWLSPTLAPLLLGNAAYLADPNGYVLVLEDGTQIAPVLVPNHVVSYSIVSAGGGDLHEFDHLSRAERHPMYQVGLSRQWDDDLLTYANWSNGAKAGGFDFLYEGASEAEAEYGDESASVFEVGFKKDWRDVRLNVALFRGRYEDLQVSVYDGGIGFLVGNAASSISKGIDVDFDWNLTNDLRLFARVEYLDFKYDRFADANCSTTERMNTGQAICDWSGRRTPFVPEFEGVFALQHSWQPSAAWRVEQMLGYNYRGSHSTASDLEPQTHQQGYGLLDYRVELVPESGHWTLALRGDNLTNEKYNVFTSVIPLSSGGAFASVPGKGREVALEVQYHY